MTNDPPSDDDERREKHARLDRRTYLTLAAAVAGGAATAGCANLPGGADRPRSGEASQLRFGYGGAPLLLLAGSAGAAAASEVEPNDACATATPVRPNETVTGTLDAAEVDWFAVDLAADEAFDVVFDRASASGVTNVAVYGPDCGFLTLRQVGTDREVSVPAHTDGAGTYFVEIVDVEEGDGEYAVRVEPERTTATPTVTPTTTPTASPTPTASDTPSPTATAVADEYGEQGYGEYGYGGVA